MVRHKRSCFFFRVIAIAILVCVSAGHAVAVPDPAVVLEFLEPTSAGILADASPKSVRFSVSFAKDRDPEKITIDVQSVVFDGLQDQTIDELFSARWDPSVPAVFVAVRLEPALAPGTYELRVRVREVGEAGTRQQIQTLTIIVPGAALRKPEKILVRQTKYFPWLDPSLSGAVLRLQETSRRSRVSELAVDQIAITAADGIDQAARLSFDVSKLALAPGKSHEITGTLRGDFPLGSVTGKLEVTATQLTEPTVVDFEVVTTWAQWLLLLAIAAGLGVGYVVKTRLKLMTELSEAKLRASGVLRKLDKPDYADPTFVARLGEIRQELDLALQSDDPAEIATQTASADEALREAVEKLEQHRVETQEELKALVGLVTKKWAVPEAMSAALARARTRCAGAQADLNRGAVDAASTAVTEIRSELLDSLLIGLTNWRQELVNAFARIDTSALPLKAVVDEEGDNALVEAKEAVSGLPDKESESSSEHLLQTCAALSKTLYRLLERVVIDLVEELDNVVATLGNAEKTAALTESSQRLAGTLGSWRPTELVGVIAGEVGSLHESLEVAIRGASSQGARPEVENLLASGSYRQAAIRAIARPRRKTERVDMILEAGVPFVGDDEGPDPRPPPQLPRQARLQMADFPAEDAGVVVQETSRIAVPPPVAVLRSQARGALLRAKRWNTAIASVLALGLGYMVFEASFVGTLDDLGAAFVWAFGIDASVEVVLEAAKKRFGKSES